MARVVRGLARVVGHHAHVAAGRTAVRRVVAVRGLRGGKIGVPLLAYGYQGDSVCGGGLLLKMETKIAGPFPEGHERLQMSEFLGGGSNS